MREGKEQQVQGTKLRKYMLVTALLVVLAVASFAIVPPSNTLKSCMSLLLLASRYNCITRLAVSGLNASMCANEQGRYADSCYAQIAEKTDQSATCASIANGSARSMCITFIARAQNNSGLCQQANEPYASACTETVALRFGNLTLCSQIKNSTDSAVCYSVLNTRSAVSFKSPAYCRNVSNTTNRNVTLLVIQNLNSGLNASSLSSNFSFTGSLAFLPSISYTPRDICYTDLASIRQNYSLCNSVSAGTARVLCGIGANATVNSSTANLTSLEKSCNNLGSYAQECIQSAILSQAVKTQNATMCTQLGSALKVDCYSLLASTYSNATYCSNISNASEKNSCISGAGGSS